ncbi:hypothetical protein ABTW96_19795 [Nocardia beijingensis]|uniref:hypothetical protein n=1 Tax=Nocardia beijingensis TaxID=95162 RepID=UPI003331FCAC
MATTPRIRVHKDGSTYSQGRYRVTRPGRSKPVQTSPSFDDHAAAIRWIRLLVRVGPVEAERILAAQLGAAPRYSHSRCGFTGTSTASARA